MSFGTDERWERPKRQSDRPRVGCPVTTRPPSPIIVFVRPAGNQAQKPAHAVNSATPCTHTDTVEIEGSTQCQPEGRIDKSGCSLRYHVNRTMQFTIVTSKKCFPALLSVPIRLAVYESLISFLSSVFRNDYPILAEGYRASLAALSRGVRQTEAACVRSTE